MTKNIENNYLVTTFVLIYLLLLKEYLFFLKTVISRNNCIFAKNKFLILEFVQTQNFTLTKNWTR